MPKIQISRKHSLGLEEAKSRVHKLAEEIQKKFPSLVTSLQWSSNRESAKISGTGFEGTFAVNDSKVEISLNLSFLATPWRSTIETQIQSGLDQNFGTA